MKHFYFETNNLMVENMLSLFILLISGLEILYFISQLFGRCKLCNEQLQNLVAYDNKYLFNAYKYEG